MAGDAESLSVVVHRLTAILEGYDVISYSALHTPAYAADRVAAQYARAPSSVLGTVPTLSGSPPCSLIFALAVSAAGSSSEVGAPGF